MAYSSLAAGDPTHRALQLVAMLHDRATALRRAQSRMVHWTAPAPAAKRIRSLARLLRWEAECAGAWSAPRGRVVRFVADELRHVELLPHLQARHRAPIEQLATWLDTLACECFTVAPRACAIT
jgi:hypothetical protein